MKIQMRAVFTVEVEDEDERDLADVRADVEDVLTGFGYEDGWWIPEISVLTIGEVDE